MFVLCVSSKQKLSGRVSRILDLSLDFAMNRQTGSRNPFATQTGFSALSIESGEDTVEEEVVEEPTDRYPFLDAATRSITIYWMHLQYACDS